MIKKIRKRMKSLTKSDVLRLMKKAVMAAGKALIYTFYGVAVMNVVLNMVFITCLTILEWMGKVVIMPDYLRIDGYFTAVIMLAAAVIMRHRRRVYGLHGSLRSKADCSKIRLTLNGNEVKRWPFQTPNSGCFIS